MSLMESRSLLSQILEGKPPSEVLNMMLELVPNLDKYALANIFLEEYSRLDSKVLPVIWNWKSAKSMRGMSDEKFNESLLLQMRSAGYKV